MEKNGDGSKAMTFGEERAKLLIAHLHLGQHQRNSKAFMFFFFEKCIGNAL